MKTIRSLWHSFIHRASLTTKMLTVFMTLMLINSILLISLWQLVIHPSAYEKSRIAFDEIVERMGISLTENVRPMQTPARYFSTNYTFLAGLQSPNYTEWGRNVYYTQVADPQLTSFLTMFNGMFTIVVYHNNPLLETHSSMIRTLEEVENEPWVLALDETDSLWRVDGDELCLHKRMPGLYSDAPKVLMDVRMKCSEAFDIALTSMAQYALLVTQASDELLWMDNRLGIDDERIRQLAQLQSGSVSAAGGEYYVRSIPLEELGWALTAVVPYDQLTLDTRAIEQKGIAMIGASLLVSLIVGIVLSRSLTWRIRRLNESMEMVMAGDWSVSIQTDEQDEIGALTRKFNELVKRLNDSMNELKSAERREKEAEIKALRAQINPHFLYNTLSLIAWKAIEQGADNVAQTVRTFSRFCRSVLNRGVTESCLADEILMVKGYVDIQREMHDDSFDVEYEIPEEYETCIVPNFVIQPLVENAIIHGIEKLDGERGCMRIIVREAEGKLYCFVMNNGEAASADTLRKALASSESYGLRNVQERIQYLCGDECGVFLGEPDAPYTTCVYLKLKLVYEQDDPVRQQ